MSFLEYIQKIQKNISSKFSERLLAHARDEHVTLRALQRDVRATLAIREKRLKVSQTRKEQIKASVRETNRFSPRLLANTVGRILYAAEEDGEKKKEKKRAAREKYEKRRNAKRKI